MLETRIKNIQKRLNVAQTAIFDKTTCNELARQLGITELSSDLIQLKKDIQKKLGFAGKEVDAIFGSNTVTKIEFFLSNVLPPIPQGACMIVSKKSIQLIIDSEISSISAYKSKYKYPTWPRSDSGVTIGIGYDLGYVSRNKFEADWGQFLDANTINKLAPTFGLKGPNAKNALSNKIKELEIPYESALEVFYTKTLPEFGKKTVKVYKGIELLPPDAQGALLSIVYNRGSSLVGTGRTEMKNIVPLVKIKDLKKIAKEIRSMKRLWENNPNTRGLLIRREAEAVLVEQANFFLMPEDYIII